MRRRALCVGGDAAHVEVRGRRDRERLARGVEAGGACEAAGAGKASFGSR